MGVPDEPQGLPPSPGELMFTLTKSTSMRMAFFVALVFSSACALPAEKITGVDEVIEAARSLEMGVAQLFNEPGFEEDNPHKYPMYVEFYEENSKRSQTKEASRNDSRSEMNPEVLLKSLTCMKCPHQDLACALQKSFLWSPCMTTPSDFAISHTHTHSSHHTRAREFAFRILLCMTLCRSDL